MAKLHELLALEQAYHSESEKRAREVGQNMSPARTLGMRRTYAALEEGGQAYPPETDLVTTVAQKEIRDFVGAEFRRWLDASVQKEITNQSTKSDVTIGKKHMWAEMPATALLNLEGKLTYLKGLYESLPTLDPDVRWNWDAQNEYWVSEPEEVVRTKKVQRPIVMYDATPEHPAQTQLISEDIPVGKWTTVRYSGAVPVSLKREWLRRIDTLLRAVKSARQRANDIDAEESRYGTALAEFIHEADSEYLR